jgi:cytochrome P450
MSTSFEAAASADIDLFDDQVLLDPYPVYAQLRETAGVVYLPQNDAYALTRYDIVRDALADYETFSSVGLGFNDMVNGALQGTSLASDPPAHTQLRAALSENLTPRALRNLKELIDAKADALVADLVEQGSFEAIDALARAFPLEVVADLIGFTGDVRNNMIRWGAAAMEVVGPLNQRTAENFPIAGELYGWCAQVSAADLTPGSVGHGVFEAEAQGTIPPGSAGHIIHQYLGAGLDSTIAAIGNTVALFAANPEQFALVRQDPSLVPAAFNEVLRFWAPLNVWGRTVTKDVEIDGTVIPAGSKAAIMIGGGNRDERHYENADAFLVERNPVDLLSFGYGIHSCAGQGLARLEGQAIIEALARRVERIVVGPEERRPSNMVRSISVLPVLEVVPA